MLLSSLTLPRPARRAALPRPCAAASASPATTSPSPPSSAPAAPPSSAALLDLVAGTDAGASASAELRAAAASASAALEASRPGVDWREDPLLFGLYTVAYSSSPQAAGGRFRSPLGRALFRTTALRQDVLPPATVRNQVAFLLFGLLPGSISLEGRFAPVGPLTVRPADNVVAGEGAAVAGAPPQTFGSAVEVYFAPPVLEVCGSRVSLGGESSVRLATTFVDASVRLGRGGFGSLFVFARETEAGRATALAAASSPAAGAGALPRWAAAPAGWLVARAALLLFRAVAAAADGARVARGVAGSPAAAAAAAGAAVAALRPGLPAALLAHATAAAGAHWPAAVAAALAAALATAAAAAHAAAAAAAAAARPPAADTAAAARRALSAVAALLLFSAAAPLLPPPPLSPPPAYFSTDFLPSLALGGLRLAAALSLSAAAWALPSGLRFAGLRDRAAAAAAAGGGDARSGAIARLGARARGRLAAAAALTAAAAAFLGAAAAAAAAAALRV